MGWWTSWSDMVLTLNLEVRELGVETQLLDNTGVLAAGKLRVILGLGTGNNHLATKVKLVGNVFWNNNMGRRCLILL